MAVIVVFGNGKLLRDVNKQLMEFETVDGAENFLRSNWSKWMKFGVAHIITRYKTLRVSTKETHEIVVT